MYDNRFCYMEPVAIEGSQCEEDTILSHLLGDGTGSYVDIGAAHPIECSNTWRLYQKGWRGLLVEPNPRSWWGLLKYRPEDYLYPACASNVLSTRLLYEQGHVSSLLDEWPIERRDLIWSRTEPTQDILDRYPDVRDTCRLCSIDVEGHEREVLQGIDWKRFHPEVFVVEYRWYCSDAIGRDISGQWAGILANNGYWHFTSTNLNQIWRRK